MAKKKKNPIIMIPENLLFENEELKFVDDDIVNDVNPYYYGSTMGRIYSISSGEFKELKPDYHKGYQRISLTTKSGKEATIAVHRIIAKLFVAPPEGKDIERDNLEVDHIHKVRWDNRASELQWVDHKTNMELSAGSDRTNVTDQVIIEVHRLVDEGYDDFYIAAETNLSPSTICMIRTGNKRFKHRLIELGLKPKYREFRVTDDVIEFIMSNVLAGKDDKTISEISGITVSTIKTIRTGYGRYKEWLKKLGYSPVLYTYEDLPNDIVLSIYDDYYNGKSEEYIMKKYHVSKYEINRIRLVKDKYKKALKGKSPIYKEIKSPRALSEDDALKAHEYGKLHSVSDMSSKFNITEMTALDVRHCANAYIFLQEKYDCEPYYLSSNIIREIALQVYNDCRNGIDEKIIADKYDIDSNIINDIKFCRNRFKFLETECGCVPLYVYDRESVPDEIIVLIMTMAINGIIDSIISKKIGYDINIVHDVRLGIGRYKDDLERLGFEPIVRTNGPFISDEEVIQIYDEYRAGIPAEEIAKKHNVGISTVRWIRLCFGRFKDILEKTGRYSIKEVNVGSYKFTEQEAIEIYMELKEKPATVIAKERTVSENTILDIKHCTKGYVYLRDKYGLPPMYSNISKDDAIKIYYRLRDGENMKIVADEIGMSYNDISNLKLCKQKYEYLTKEYGLTPIYTRISND